MSLNTQIRNADHVRINLDKKRPAELFDNNNNVAFVVNNNLRWATSNAWRQAKQ
ncbi:hypothetical protein DPMN_048155 [Dreissena polymorpha]|uniref:Uncharacterized protein n=1 Tax=Dreissena polymorpha TaxID=45954 RepID=A0A9D4HZV0_DREPO|nr:hypothetical protein DPMN_048155 [Dreissena polymorpha]